MDTFINTIDIRSEKNNNKETKQRRHIKNKEGIYGDIVLLAKSHGKNGRDSKYIEIEKI